MFEIIDQNPQEAVIKVIGVGGCGGNAIEHMIERQLQGVEFIAAYPNDPHPGAQPQMAVIILKNLLDRVTRQTMTGRNDLELILVKASQS